MEPNYGSKNYRLGIALILLFGEKAQCNYKGSRCVTGPKDRQVNLIWIVRRSRNSYCIEPNVRNFSGILESGGPLFKGLIFIHMNEPKAQRKKLINSNSRIIMMFIVLLH